MPDTPVTPSTVERTWTEPTAAAPLHRASGERYASLLSDFQAAIDELAGSAQRTRITVMCAEEDPRRCHRHLLLSPALRRLGAGVRHIRGDGSLERDEDLTPPSLFPRSGALILSPR